MGFLNIPVFSIRNRLLVISFFLLASTRTQKPFAAQGSPILKINQAVKVKEENFVGRALIGSSRPRCEGRCTNCGRQHCEAIQVPVVPQQGFPRTHFVNTIAYYSRGDSLSNYKPMSWKCKCGDSIFNP